MAASTIPKPGKLGPCKGECQHTDCAETRRMAAAGCRICGEAIGYGRRFYSEGAAAGAVLVHAACLEDEAEKWSARP